jgi:DNA-directed RNA polymerase omega subunit
MSNTPNTDGPDGGASSERWQEGQSRFRLIVVASLRAKQLLRGARPRIEADIQRRRNTSIALEEVRRGLVPFTLTDEPREKNGGGRKHE